MNSTLEQVTVQGKIVQIMGAVVDIEFPPDRLQSVRST